MAHPKGGITGSDGRRPAFGDRVKTGTKKRGRPPKKSTNPPTKSTIELIGQGAATIAGAVDEVANTVGRVKDTVQTVGNAVKKVRSAVNPSPLVEADSITANDQAISMASAYGIQLTNLDNALAGSNFEVDESLPQITSKEANQRQLIVERQNNALDVVYSRIKQKRKQVRNHKEEWSLVGDVVDLSSTKKEVATKVVNYQITDTKFKVSQSKLEENEELLEQHIIKTQGIISLTESIRQEWDLRLQKQYANNESLMIQIEQADNKNARDREKIESFLLEGGQ